MLDPILTANDYERSCTTFSLPVVAAAVRDALDGRVSPVVLDVGCGYGGVVASIGRAVRAGATHGVDIDMTVIDEAQAKGVQAVCTDVGAEGLPYDAGTFDLVTCFGMLDYLPWFDDAVAEMSRVLAPGGVVAVSLPNLASWHNRLALLFGFQPRDVEFCRREAVGLAPYYRSAGSRTPVGHIHAPTTRAFRQFMAVMGFEEQRTVALRPDNNRPPAPLRLLDSVVGRFPSSARRFLYLGRRVRDPQALLLGGWWASGPRSRSER